MKRILFNDLREWREKDGRKPLILQGARQVGKTWLLKEFGNQWITRNDGGYKR